MKNITESINIPIEFFITKVHSRCNINCSYCYEYNQGNTGWKRKPKSMSIEVFTRLCERISEQCKTAGRETWPFISFHGGEPLLQSPSYFDALMTIARNLIPNVKFGMQSNGILLTQNHIDIFLKHGLQMGISIDGPAEFNDKHRVDHQGQGTFSRVIKGIELLNKDQNKAACGGNLCVIDITNNPEEIIQFFRDLDTPGFDLLEPDGNWHKLPPNKNKPESTEYGDWLVKAFDYWFDTCSEIKLRRFEEIIEHLLGGSGSTEYFGVEPANLITIATDGSYEAVDQIKSAYDGAEFIGLNVFDHSLEQVVAHTAIQQRLIGQKALSDKCLACEFKLTCGGGYYPHRYKETNGFKNPSIYCADYKILFTHIRNRLQVELNNA
jgi:uncharacterized protein